MSYGYDVVSYLSLSLPPRLRSPSALKESTTDLVVRVFELKPHPRLAEHIPANGQQLVLHEFVGRKRQAFLSPSDSPMSDTSGPRASRGDSLVMQGGRDGCELLMLAKDTQKSICTTSAGLTA